MATTRRTSMLQVCCVCKQQLSLFRSVSRPHWHPRSDPDPTEALPANLLACQSGKDFIAYAKSSRFKVETSTHTGSKTVIGPPPESVKKNIPHNSTPVIKGERSNILHAFYLMGAHDQQQWWCALRNTWCEDHDCVGECKAGRSHS